jgi:hypothetical protein
MTNGVKERVPQFKLELALFKGDVNDWGFNATTNNRSWFNAVLTRSTVAPTARRHFDLRTHK